MLTKLLLIGLAIVLFFGLVMYTRFTFDGNEDSWICENGAWVKHGYPGVPRPVGNCVK